MAGRKDLEAGGAFVRLYLRDELTRKLVRTLRTAGQKLQNFGRAAQQMGRQIATASAAMLVPIGLATRTFANFQDEMLTVKAVTGATGEAFDALNEKAKELGRSTSFTAAQVAGAMVSLGRAGFASDEIDASIADMLNLARATGTELPEAAEIAAASLRSFGLAANEMGRVADVMTATANNAALTLTDLGESMKLAAPIADEFGLSIEETALAIGTLANFGIKGTMAGTGLRQIMLQLSDPAIRKRLEGLGVSLDSFGATMLDIGRVSQDMTGTERLAFLKELFGQRAAGAGAKLGKEAFEKLADAIDNAAGTAAKTAKIMDSGLGGSFRRLWSAVEGTAIALGGVVAGPLKQFADLIAPIAIGFAQWIEANRGLVTAIVATTAAAGLLGVAIFGVGAAITVLGIVVSAVAAIATAISTIGIPTLAAVAAVAALGTALVGAAGYALYASGALGKLWSGLKEIGGRWNATFKGMADAVSAGDLQLAFRILAEGLKLEWYIALNSMTEAWVEFKNQMLDIVWIQTLVTAISFAASEIERTIGTTIVVFNKLGESLKSGMLGEIYTRMKVMDD
ncbi:MAG: phage tail tape measure protein [Planctomycetes bacterium]|nr:phage tail tape measure protein [Planctomycetota bacterium]